jgi:aspartate kinase
MKPTIMKFGGTSVEGATAFKNAARIVFDRQALLPIVVVSAMAGFTDALLDSVQQGLNVGAQDGATKGIEALEKHFDRHLRVIDALLREEAARMRALLDQSRDEIAKLLNNAAAEVGKAEVNDRKRRKFADAVVSYGERLSAAMLAAVLRENKIVSRSVDARQCIITNDDYGCAMPLMAQTIRNTKEQLQPLIESSCIPVLGGFIGSTLTGETTTLGRGGSDYTAALIGAALAAKEIQIWTDVPGVLTADPRLVSRARTVPHLSFEEAA